MDCNRFLVLKIRRYNHNSEVRGCSGGWIAYSDENQPPYHDEPQMISTQRIWWMIIRRVSQLMKPQILQSKTAQPKPSVSGTQGTLYLSFEL